MRTKLLSFALIVSFPLFFIANAADNISCNNNRYKNFTFLTSDVTTNVQFGQNNSDAGVSKNLLMDIYQPSGDIATKRPLIILLHGGSFYLGSRSDMSILCDVYSKMGFVTATIDYRLVDVPMTDSLVVADAIAKGISDTKAAIRFFMKDAATINTYRISTENIIVGGVSAGAIIASNTAYLNSTDNIPAYFAAILANNGGFTGNSDNNISYSTPIKAVLNFSGAMWRKSWMNVGESALFSVHDLNDPTVPCGYATPSDLPFQVFMYGSCEMQNRANSEGIINAFISFPTSTHVSYFAGGVTSTALSVIAQSGTFLEGIICSPTTSLNETLENRPVELQVFPNPASNKISVSITNKGLLVGTIQIYNLLGVLIKDVRVIEKTDIDISDLANGFYTLNLKNGEQKAVKFIKQ